MSDNIPLEVQMDIISRLSVKSVAQCRSVCKNWKANIDTLHFIAVFGVRLTTRLPNLLIYLQRWKSHVNFVDQNFSLTPFRCNINFTDMEPIGWSDGVWGFSYGPIVQHWIGFVWNPSIKKSVGTFIPYLTQAQEYEKRFLAFGIRPDNLDPTLLKISFHFNPTDPWTVLIFTFSSREWRILERQYLLPNTVRIKKSTQANIGRHIYWCGYETFFGNDGNSYKSYAVISFDLVTTRFHLIHIPDQLLRQIPLPFKVSSLGDKLILSGNTTGDEMFFFSVWVLQVVGGTILSFTEYLNVPTPTQMRLIGFHENVDPIIEVPNEDGCAANFVLYKIATGNFEPIGIPESDAGSFTMNPFIESLILLNHDDQMVY